MSFTLFVILPNEDVCSLRRLPSPSSIKAVRKMLEMSAGLPAQTYDLACPDGKLLADNRLLQLDENVWDGYVMRAVVRESWRELHEAVLANEVDHVLERCGAHVLNNEGDGNAKELTKEKGVVALFMASFLGLAELCKALLCAGVDADSKTPFGRTPLFAVMAGDHAHAMELLLSYHASLESRDVDGTSALDMAHERQARECLRKARYLKLFSRASSATSMTSRTSARGSDTSGGLKTQRRVIRIPTGTSVEAEASSAQSNDKTELPCDDGSLSPAGSDSSPRPQEPHSTSEAPKPSAVQTTGSRPSPRTLFRHSEVYTWENNLRPLSRASSAAGTQVRIPVAGSGRERVSSGRSSRASNDRRVSWSDTVSVGSGNNRRSSLRLSIQDLAISGPDAVLKVSCPVSPPHTNHTADRKLASTENDQTVLKHCVNQELSSGPVSDTKQANRPHSAAQERPERPPSSLGNPQVSREEDNQALAGSILITVPGPEQTAKGHCEKGHVDGARDRGFRSSPRTGPRLARSRRKQQASWRAMKRRLRLSEDQKRKASPKSKATQSRNKDAARASFEQWLQKKRKEKQRQQDSSEAESSSDDDDDEKRSAENQRAFNDWLRELKERPLKGPHPFTPASLHRRKSRPLKNLIQIGGNSEESVPPPDPDSYMRAYKDWRRDRSSAESDQQLTSPRDLKEAKKRMEEKRKSVLAAALTYEDWLELDEEQQKLMQAILRADSNKMADTEQTELRTRRAPRQISFHEWSQRVQKREAELRHEKQHMRKQTEPYHDKNGFLVNDNMRSSAAIPHDEWLKRKTEELQKIRNKKETGDGGIRKTGPTVEKKQATSRTRQKENAATDISAKGNRAVVVSEDGEETAWEMWLQRKHQSEMEQLSQNTYEGKQLLLSLQQKKMPRVTQC